MFLSLVAAIVWFIVALFTGALGFTTSAWVAGAVGSVLLAFDLGWRGASKHSKRAPSADVTAAEPEATCGVGETGAALTNANWVEHAYPLQQIRVELQGTRHSNRSAIVDQLETVIARLRGGDDSGSEHDDDFGYRFGVESNGAGPSFFDDEPAGRS